MKTLSVIIPAYNEENMIAKTARTISQVLEDAHISYELLFINDGSRDMTWPAIQKAAEENPRVVGICFSRNFGKEAAMFAGLEQTAGDCAVIIDCDLQHPPEKIVEMYRLWEEGYEVVEGVKEDRGKEGAFHRFCANTFYKIISRLTKIDMANASDFKLMDRKVVDILVSMPERNRFFRALSSWVGFKKTTVGFRVQERTAGKSKWSAKSLIRYAVANITSFSSAPMQIASFLGGISLLTAAIGAIVSLVCRIIGKPLSPFTGLVFWMLLIGGAVLLGLGILGYYTARLYEEVKGRPPYIIATVTRTESPKNS